MLCVNKGTGVRHLSPHIDGYVSFPDEYLHPTIKKIDIGSFSGSRNIDKTAAIEILKAKYGLSKIPKGYVLHHDVQNGVLQLVRKDVHSTFTHIGGHSLCQS